VNRGNQKEKRNAKEGATAGRKAILPKKKGALFQEFVGAIWPDKKEEGRLKTRA